MATSATASPINPPFHGANLYIGLKRFGLPEQFIKQIDEDEGIAYALLQLINMFKDALRHGKKNSGGTITLPQSVSISGSHLSRNLSHAGADQEDVQLLCNDARLQSAAVRVISEYRTALASNMQSFYFGFQVEEN